MNETKVNITKLCDNPEGTPRIQLQWCANTEGTDDRRMALILYLAVRVSSVLPLSLVSNYKYVHGDATRRETYKREGVPVVHAYYMLTTCGLKLVKFTAFCDNPDKGTDRCNHTLSFIIYCHCVVSIILKAQTNGPHLAMRGSLCVGAWRR